MDMKKKRVVRRVKARKSRKPVKASNWGWEVLVAIIFAFIVASAVFFIVRQGPKQCDTVECFLTEANKCGSVIFLNKIATASIQYTADEDCNVLKEIIKLDESEPKEAKLLFEGTSMLCSYDKGNFNEEMLTTFTANLDNCEGSLRNIIELV